MVRAPFYDKNGIKKGAWSSEEDEKLRAYVERYGHWNWRELPKYAGLSRCGKSCRLRWMNYLRPDVKRGNYTAEEENIIINLHEEHGNKWSLIAANLPGRTDNEIKNYWHTHLKKRTSHKTPTTSQTDQDQSCEWSHECDQITSHGNGETEAESSNLDNNHAELSPTILESSQSPSDMSTYSSEPSFLISHTSDQSDANYSYENNNITDNYLYSSLDQAFYEEYSTGSDFWTKPFMEDKMTSQNDDQYPTTCFGDGGNSSLYLSLYDDGMEYFYYH